MRDWREDQLAKFGKKKSTPGSFEANVRGYLKKPEIAEREKRHPRAFRQLVAILELWLDA